MTRVALVVGINTYTHFKNLEAPAQDAEAIAQALQQDGEFKVTRLPEALSQETGEYSPTVASTHPVTQATLEQALKQLFKPDSSQIPDTALFYFSGHGIPDNEGFDKGYLATSDTNPENPRLAISLRWLHWLLSESPIRNQIVWLDCCHSGGLLIDVSAANPGHNQNHNRCFIASSRAFEQSWQDLNSPYSVLTKALLAGLDPRRVAGRWVDTFNLVDYVNQALKGELQTPTCTNFGDAINLTRPWKEAELPDPEPDAATDICPYKGLEFFDCNQDDPQYFFGRESLTSELLDRVRTSQFLALVGASGNGKSSVLRAGLLHQLQLGRRIAGSDQWSIRIIRPEKTPLQNLALAFVDAQATGVDRAEQLGKAEKLIELGAVGLRRLVQTDPAPKVVLVIDQFEEVFTRCEDVAEREQFFAGLMGALAETGDKLCLIIAMRADFVGKCLERDYSGLAQRVQAQMVSVLPLTEPELKDAICQPAQQVGLEVEPRLVAEIQRDIKNAPGSLPLLQDTLKELWKQRRHHTLTLDSYLQLGRIDGTLNKRATDLYNQAFDEAEQRTVRHIFQQLTQLGEGTEDTRRRVFIENLVAAPLHPRDRVETVIATLANSDNRLLVTSEVMGKGGASERRAIVDVAHEALIRHWQLLQHWLDQNRDILRQQRRIEASAVTWQTAGKPPGYLLQGLALAEAMQFRQQQADALPLSEAANQFIQKSIEQRRWGRLKTASWLVIPALLIGGVVEYNLREAGLRADYDRIMAQHGTPVEREAVIDRVSGCRKQVNVRAGWGWLDRYVTERLFGNCRSLENADLIDADLSGADLRGADLRGANLRGAELYVADLRDADLRDADLSGAYLGGAYLFRAYLFRAELSGANLRRADLNGANLNGADLSGADLSGVYLSGAKLSGADLSGAELYVADLSGADLRDAYLSGANLRRAELSGATLLATDFRRTRQLTAEQFTGESPPDLCNVALPDNIIGIDPNRDCDAIPQRLVDLYVGMTLEQAQEMVDDARQKEWD